MKYFGIVALLLIIITSGCKQNIVAKPDAKEQGAQQKEMQQPQQTKAPQKITEQKVESIDSKDLQPKQATDNLFSDILFAYDRYDIGDSGKPVAKAVAAWLQKNPAARLLIEGHCDERGTNEYNLALGDRRAKAVKDYLAALGIAAKRIETISYGEEKPLCTQQTEECWSKNRRAHFVVLQDIKK